MTATFKFTPLSATAQRCDCGRATGNWCSLPAQVEIEWMPGWRRASHRAAGNWGSWPHNGAELLRVSVRCADELQASVEDGDAAAVRRH